jgi:hypothetical protein
MTKLSRRGFLGQTSAGAATIGALLAMPGLAEVTNAAGIPRSELTKAELEGPIVAHIRNLHTGEIAIMVGTREIVYRDQQFVKRLVKALR